MKYGDVATWVEAVGTTGALFVGLALLRRDGDDRRARADDARRAQAEKVTAWMAGLRLIGLRNSSDAVVDDVYIFYRVLPNDGPMLDLEWPVGPLPPGETTIPLYHPEPAQWSLRGIQFRDAAGRVWVRDSGNGLTLAFSPGPAPRPSLVRRVRGTLASLDAKVLR